MLPAVCAPWNGDNFLRHIYTLRLFVVLFPQSFYLKLRLAFTFSYVVLYTMIFYKSTEMSVTGNRA